MWKESILDNHNQIVFKCNKNQNHMLSLPLNNQTPHMATEYNYTNTWQLISYKFITACKEFRLQLKFQKPPFGPKKNQAKEGKMPKLLLEAGSSVFSFPASHTITDSNKNSLQKKRKKM